MTSSTNGKKQKKHSLVQKLLESGNIGDLHLNIRIISSKIIVKYAVGISNGFKHLMVEVVFR
jgi:hypothetical protein